MCIYVYICVYVCIYNKTASVDDLMGRIEYGYGSGYINGYLETEKLCFSADMSGSQAPCINGVKILEAD